MPRNTSGLRRGGPGRPKGVPNKVTLEAKAICSALVDNPVYLKKLEERLHAGELAPAMECAIWYYAKGKPTEHVDLTARQVTPLVIDKVSTRKEMIEAIGELDTDAGSDDDDE